MKQPDMAFLGSEFPEPGMQPASERYEVHPATQHLHDTGFGPIPECGDVVERSEWRMWAVIAVLLAPWVYGITWFYLNVWPKQ